MRLEELDVNIINLAAFSKFKRLYLRFGVDIIEVNNTGIVFELDDTSYIFSARKGKIRELGTNKWEGKVIKYLSKRHPDKYSHYYTNEQIMKYRVGFENQEDFNKYFDGNYFKFGKYKGFTYKEILEHNPNYIKWCEENLDKFKLFCPESI